MNRSIAYRISCFSALICIALACQATLAADGDKKAEKPAATKEIKVDDITLKVPASWKEEKTASNFRKAQFKIEKAEGDSEPGELVVFYFPGGGGDVDANIKRWIGQFDAKERKAKTMQGESPQGKYVIADITGTYNMPVGPIVQQKTRPLPGARMLSVMLSVPDKGNYFLKLTGPEKTVTAAAKAFRTSFGGDASKEKDLKVEE